MNHCTRLASAVSRPPLTPMIIRCPTKPVLNGTTTLESQNVEVRVLICMAARLATCRRSGRTALLSNP